ncbi:methylosome subunit pICln-like isoform X2 [Liolophura sinensis]|uniref:methylosome subunit pICln-like isoform X2 n=1 Tax=Liolophura sinensis TaxID=3198878 RepID=UPI003158F19A
MVVILRSFPPPTDGVRLNQSGTQAFIGDKSYGSGSLYITESCVSWISDAGQGFTLEYKKISLHAVSRDLTAFPHECLYLMVEGKLPESAAGDESSSSSSDEDDQVTTDVRFVPADKGTLDAMFEAMSDCQALHPDDEDSFSDGDDDGYYEDAEEAELTQQGQATLDRLEEMFMARGDNPHVHPNGQIQLEAPGPVPEQGSEEPMDQGQFEDADG